MIEEYEKEIELLKYKLQHEIVENERLQSEINYLKNKLRTIIETENY